MLGTRQAMGSEGELHSLQGVFNVSGLASPGPDRESKTLDRHCPPCPLFRRRQWDLPALGCGQRAREPANEGLAGPGRCVYDP